MPDNPREERLYQAIGRRIASARKERSPRWTQSDLATHTAGALSRSTLANIESGRQRVSVHQLYEISAALGLAPADLLPQPHELPPAAEDLLNRADAGDRAFVEEVRAASQRRSVFDQRGETDR